MSIALFSGASVRIYKAYWHMNFSLINGCGTCKNIHDHYFLSEAYEFANIIIVTENVNKVVCNLQSIGFIAIKVEKQRQSSKPAGIPVDILIWDQKCSLEYLQVKKTTLVSLLFIAMIPIDCKLQIFLYACTIVLMS